MATDRISTQSVVGTLRVLGHYIYRRIFTLYIYVCIRNSTPWLLLMLLKILLQSTRTTGVYGVCLECFSLGLQCGEKPLNWRVRYISSADGGTYRVWRKSGRKRDYEIKPVFQILFPLHHNTHVYFMVFFFGRLMIRSILLPIPGVCVIHSWVYTHKLVTFFF